MQAPVIGKIASDVEKVGEAGTVAVSAYPVKRKGPLTTTVNGSHLERETGFGPATSSLGSNTLTVVSDNCTALASTPPPVCTRVCTSEAENANDSPPGAQTSETADGGDQTQSDLLRAITAAIGALSAADRARLGKMLLGE
jgi:hypothetical protein